MSIKLGLSPDASQIYAQYVTYYNTVTSDIHDIDSLPDVQRQLPNVVSDRAALVGALSSLGTVYQKDYANSQATLASFQNDCAPIEAIISSAYEDAMGKGNPIQRQIRLAYANAQTISSSALSGAQADQTILTSVAGVELSVVNLQKQIDAMQPGSTKDQAQSDLNKASATLTTLKASVSSAQTDLSPVQAELNAITVQGGTLDQLEALANLSNPVQADADKATALLAVVQTAQNNLGSFETQDMTSVNAGFVTVNQQIQTVKRDIQPTPPPGQIEHACWYIDWTSWDTPIPEGVNMVHIFVGKLVMGADGKPTAAGFGNITLDQLDIFVKACQANSPPIQVKVSIGGGGGSYDNCWDILTETNTQVVAQGLADFCHDHGLAGIDFDYEEYKSVDQEALVGTLIRQFKGIDPALQTSLCANAGFGDSYPWQAVVKNILDAAVDPDTKRCALDRLYIMSYYEAMDQEEGWLLGWADWVKTNYGIERSNVSVGIDDFDTHAYDIGAFSAWAGSQGFSTGYWTWNPATASQSNQSSTKIVNSYNSSSFKDHSVVNIPPSEMKIERTIASSNFVMETAKKAAATAAMFLLAYTLKNAMFC